MDSQYNFHIWELEEFTLFGCIFKKIDNRYMNDRFNKYDQWETIKKYNISGLELPIKIIITNNTDRHFLLFEFQALNLRNTLTLSKEVVFDMNRIHSAGGDERTVFNEVEKQCIIEFKLKIAECMHESLEKDNNFSLLDVALRQMEKVVGIPPEELMSLIYRSENFSSYHLNKMSKKR